MGGIDEMDEEIKRMTFCLLAGPICVAVAILALAGEVDFLYLFR